MDIENISILGAGTMGHGIAQAAIFSGLEVCLYDVSQAFLDSAANKIKANIDKRFVEKGKITPEEGMQIFDRMQMYTNLEDAVKNAEFVIEAVTEDINLKKELFAKVDKICPEHCILATNTSVLSVTAIAGATNRKDKVVGTHFFNPAAVMKLVEVVLPIGISDETVDTAMAVVQRMGKVPVKVKDVPCFIVNRLLGPLYMEAAQMVLEGTATPEDIDTAMKLGCGHPMGPCELADLGGFDVIQMGQDATFEYTRNSAHTLNILYRKMLEAGRLGRKNNKGFYDYLPDGSKKPFKLF